MSDFGILRVYTIYQYLEFSDVDLHQVVINLCLCTGLKYCTLKMGLECGYWTDKMHE